MKRIIRLTESDLARIVRRVIREDEEINHLPEVTVTGKRVIKVKAWNNQKDRDSNKPADLNLDTTGHKISNTTVKFLWTIASDGNGDENLETEGFGGIGCQGSGGRIYIKSTGPSSNSSFNDNMYVSEAGRKKLTALCDEYASNDTKTDNNYA